MRREIHPKLSKNVGAINSCRSSAVSLAGSSSSRRRRASRQTSFKCALKFHQLATSRKPSRRLYQVRLLLSYLAGQSTRRVSPMGSVSGSVVRTTLVVLWITRYSNPDTKIRPFFPRIFSFFSLFRLLFLPLLRIPSAYFRTVFSLFVTTW